MRSNILKPGKLLLGAAIVAVASSVIWSCTLEPYIITAEEQYTRNFIKDFGLIDPNQDWNLAKEATVSINLGDAVHKSVKIYAKTQDKYYLVADLTDISGRLDVPVDVPKSTTDFMVVTSGRKYYGGLAAPIDCSDMSRGIPFSSYEDDGTNPNPVVYEASKGDYGVMVQHTTSGNGGKSGYGTEGDEYQYFNTQQISPLISTVPWSTYYSINTGNLSYNLNGYDGLLPESGIYNRKSSDLQETLDKNKERNHTLVRDFRINTGDDGCFTLFPYYYGTNLKHELGVYLLDENGNPILKSGTYQESSASTYTLDDFVSFPVFEDCDPGDLQVQPHYDGRINDIRLNDRDSKYSKNGGEIKWENELVFQLGGNDIDLEELVEIKLGDTWIPYREYLADYDGKTYHGRVAYHFWVEEAWKSSDPKPVVYATCTNDGIVTPKNPTPQSTDYDKTLVWASVGIATDMGHTSGDGINNGAGRVYGKEVAFPYRIEKLLSETEKNEVNKIVIKNSQFSMHVGDKKELEVELQNVKGDVLSWEDNFDKIKVTENWYPECKIYKNEAKIIVEAKGAGEFWPGIYIGSDWEDEGKIYAQVGVTISGHSIVEDYDNDNCDVFSVKEWNSRYFQPKTVGGTSEIVSNQQAEGYKLFSLDHSFFKEVNEEYILSFVFETEAKIHLQYPDWSSFESEFTYSVDGEKKQSSNKTTDEVKEFDVHLNSLDIAKLKEKGLAINPQLNENLSIKSITLSIPGGDGEGNIINVWKSGGKDEAVDDLMEHYKKNAPTGSHTCVSCGKPVTDFTGMEPTVTISDDAGYNKIHYTLTWTTPVKKSSANSSRKAFSRPRLMRSRVDDEDELTRREFLNDIKQWYDVNSFWSRYLPGQQEVASFPPNVTMLARSRGYDITITYKGEPWRNGNLGMYLKVLGTYESDGTTDKYIAYQDKDRHPEEVYHEKSEKPLTSYVVFSQSKFNKDENGNLSRQISALTVKHPVSERTFMTFEDMRLTNNTEQYNYWDRSSDRDVNDLIFNISNFGSVKGDDPKEEIKEDPTDPTEETISWLWAVEDLGATDDFDFNDMVMKITSVTGNQVTKDKDGNETGKVELYKKVTFQPLCAGGTLPLYVQYTKDGKTYTLKPGVFKEEGLKYEGSEFKGASKISEIQRNGEAADDASEIHSWFGDGTYPSTMMINTSGSGAIKAKTCVLYLKDGFSIEGFGSGSVKGPKGGLTVYVKDDRTQQDYSDITDGDEGWIISTPDPGKVSQMFMIYDANTKWRWPIERTHILNAYPKFKEWVNSPSDNAEWFNGGVKECTVPRNDLGETE